MSAAEPDFSSMDPFSHSELDIRHFADLYEGARGGGDDAARELIEHFQPFANRYLLKRRINECEVLGVFSDGLSKLLWESRYDPTRRIGPYFQTILRNVASDVIRARKNQKSITEGAKPAGHEPEFDVELAAEAVDRAQFVAEIKAAVNGFSERQRTIARADFEAGGQANTEILAEILVTTVESIRSSRAKYRKKLRELFGEAYGPARASPGVVDEFLFIFQYFDQLQRSINNEIITQMSTYDPEFDPAPRWIVAAAHSPIDKNYHLSPFAIHCIIKRLREVRRERIALLRKPTK